MTNFAERRLEKCLEMIDKPTCTQFSTFDLLVLALEIDNLEAKFRAVLIKFDSHIFMNVQVEVIAILFVMLMNF